MPSSLPASELKSPRHAGFPRCFASPTALLLLVVLCLTYTLTIASAHPYVIPETLVPPTKLPPSVLEELAELEAQGVILLDTRPAPRVPSDWDLAAISSGLMKRGYADLQPRKESEETESESTPSKTSAPSSTSAPVKITTTASPALQTVGALPTAFDSNIGSNFTVSTCPQFITSFLADPEFKQCLPVSLLLESSDSMFNTMQSPYLTTALLDHSCAAPSNCSSYLSSLALSLNQTCAADLALGNPTAGMAYAGLLAYPTLLSATCLKSATGSYCFADAITNSTSSEDAYIYYMGLGQALPLDTIMTCNTCLRNTVAVFGAAAANRTAPVSAVYAQGAAVVNGVCGKGWVNATLPNPLTGAAAGGQFGGIAGVVVAMLVAVMLV